MAWVFDTHPADSRVVGPVKVAGCVVARYGTGGGNTPMVVDVLCRASTQGGAESQMNTATTLTTDHDRTIIAHKNEAMALQGNIIDRDAGMNGAGVGEDVSFTLNTVDRHGVAYDTGCLTPGEAQEQRCYSADATAPTLQSRECGGGQGKSFVQKAGENTQPKYIVRRLMPMECGRLQGFPDGWGEIEQLTADMPEETAAFWRKVYTTDRAIKGKKPQKSILKKTDKQLDEISCEVEELDVINDLYEVTGISMDDVSGEEIPCKKAPIGFTYAGMRLLVLRDECGGIAGINERQMEPIMDELKNGQYMVWYRRTMSNGNPYYVLKCGMYLRMAVLPIVFDDVFAAALDEIRAGLATAAAIRQQHGEGEENDG